MLMFAVFTASRIVVPFGTCISVLFTFMLIIEFPPIAHYGHYGHSRHQPSMKIGLVQFIFVLFIFEKLNRQQPKYDGCSNHRSFLDDVCYVFSFLISMGNQRTANRRYPYTATYKAPSATADNDNRAKHYKTYACK